jgi:hypothetical protein
MGGSQPRKPAMANTRVANLKRRKPGFELVKFIGVDV